MQATRVYALQFRCYKANKTRQELIKRSVEVEIKMFITSQIKQLRINNLQDSFISDSFIDTVEAALSVASYELALDYLIEQLNKEKGE